MNISYSLLSLLAVVGLVILGEVFKLKFSKKVYFVLALVGLGTASYFLNQNDSALGVFSSQIQYSSLGGFFVSVFIGLMFSVFLVLLFQKHLLPRSVELTLILFLMFIIWDIAKKSNAGKTGTFALFLALSVGFVGYMIKVILQWQLEK